MRGVGPLLTARRCAVLGSPIEHSLSPVLHRAAYAAWGLDWHYDAVEVTEAELPGFLGALGSEWRGLSLTMPLKRAVVPLLDELSEVAERTQAANTVLLDGERRTGHNTDVPGAERALRERLAGRPVDRAVVLGGGATAASVLLALADLGCQSAVLAVRDAARADATLEVVGRHRVVPEVAVTSLGPQGLAEVEADVLVSTVPAAAQDAVVCGLARRTPVVFDVVYDPWPTPVAAAARDGGRVLVGGLDLLVHQAVLQVELMTGRAPAPLDLMRVAGENALAQRSVP